MFHHRRLFFFDVFLWIATGLAVLSPIPSVVMATTESTGVGNGRLFRENFQRLQTLGMCGIPRPRVFYVEDHPEVDATLTYHPSATVLHRCDPSGGCCLDRRKQCGPLVESVVTVVFFVHPNRPRQPVAVADGTSTANRALFKSLEFVNHTQCTCSDINDVPRR
ncbi:uncharacterized protein LOC124326594 [Daphnia pulicaria]|uniref:uncharacterized protein LOC124326594 n=1 Tax=Daphnia pulicaria TaxID=35523 RepID=UPI001EEA585D|nr:uncharacterized protein LOC124326594 [Daphnia pulicaria]